LSQPSSLLVLASAAQAQVSERPTIHPCTIDDPQAPKRLENILKSPTIPEETKRLFMQQAMEQRKFVVIPATGGTLLYCTGNGTTQFIPTDGR
jgi:hypothetical protein